ncbi:uncharacterized protein LOC141653604 isoform X1 [Silene latifolia]|uniref:uncharacterized protein LOC141653604 isoform X1 n=1 Tax=Silene latifolia TaxID=37657 RepID=UPI003D77E9A5
MEFFAKAKAVRLRSQHNKYLVAAEDEESVKQSRSGSSKTARWSVEQVDNKPNVIRLKNCQSWKYLSATDDPFLLGMTGRRVGQSSPRLQNDPTVEWEPIREGSQVKLRTRKGNFLRANGGIPPWNNSVTHDVPSRTSTQDWILWAVDVLEVDYESTVEMKESSSLSRNSSSGSTISKADYFKDCYEVGSPTATASHRHSSPHQGKESNQSYSGDEFSRSSLSRNSSSGSTVSKPDDYKECSEKETVSPSPAVAPKSVRSVRHSSTAQRRTQSPKEIQQVSEKQTRVSAFANHVRDKSRHSDSFNKLRSVLNGLDDLLDDDNDVHEAQSEAESEPIVESPLHKPHLLEVKMAKHTLKELNSFDYETFLSSGKEKKLEEALKILIADFKMSGRGQVPEELQSLLGQLKTMRQDHDSASRDMEEYTTFSIRRLEVKGELKKDASKAHELETLEEELSNMLTSSRAKREELLKQLEEVENSIKVTEKALSDNGLEIDELVLRIGEKSECLREMERNDKSWQARKVDAENTLEKVEDDWVNMKGLFEDV